MSQSDYGFLSRLLHRVALGFQRLGQLWFDLEESKTEKGPVQEVVRPVFVVGMARSGSTILLNALYNTGAFRSLIYRDMPFILMSGIWKNLSSGTQVQTEKKERMHGDRLMVDFDSPEAFEEVFWRTFHGPAYIHEDRVVAHNVPAAVRNKFKKFVQHVLLSRKTLQQARYLSKNNNNLLRVAAIRKTFPDALVLITFREPLQQALSLQRQHQLFLKKHHQDKFSMDYMMWLGHYEFGLGHKQYVYDDTDNPHDHASLDYWLRCWRDAYEYALDTAPADTLFLSYEHMCAAPLTTFTRLFLELDLDSAPEQAAEFYSEADVRDAEGYSSALYADCSATHSKLVTRHIT